MRVYRKLLPPELGRFRDHLLRLTPEDRQSRFSGSVGNAFIEDHCRRFDWLSGAILGAFDNGELTGAAELRWLKPGLDWRAEVAITVDKNHQEQGIGTELLRRVVIYARNRSLKALYMVCMTDNRRMQAIARKLEGQLVFEASQVEADIVMPFPTQFTLFDEALGNSVAFAAHWWEQFAPARRVEA
jgi:RimJ/RimL family protein N-acetyltransferase